MRVTTKGRIPIKSWCEDVEDGAMEQANNLSNLPFAFHHIALMPDCHQGYGMPIGGVMAADNVIVPNCVGVDIGCGMCAVQTSLEDINVDTIKAVFSDIRSIVPVGFDHHAVAQDWGGFNECPDIPLLNQELKSARHQLGTLGGGNHFIEIQGGDDGYVWLMLHSGSRNYGFKIANEYHKKAVELCERWFSAIPTKELAFLPIGSKEAAEYLDAMNFALRFAYANRALMMVRCKEALSIHTGCTFENEINIHHNYVAIEHHFRRNVWVHRKGATLARAGEYGIIPGSQGTASYIVIGKGNPESFQSCSHGAGRSMGRKEAERTLVLEDVVRGLNEAGIVHSIRTQKDLDEAPQAYKDIDAVMAEQSDLVDIAVTLKPLGVIKG